VTTRSACSDRASFAGISFAAVAGLSVDVDVVHVGDAFAVTRWRCHEGHALSREKQQPWHVLSFVHCGSFRIRSRRGRDVCDPSAILLLRPAEDYQTAHVSCCGDFGSAIVLTPETAQSFAEMSESHGGGDPWDSHVRRASADLLAHKMRLLRRLDRGAVDALAMEEALLDLTGRVLLPAAPLRSRAAASTIDRVAATQELLERRFTEPLRLSEIARAVELSPFHLSRQFRAHTGWTIHRYLTHLRVAHGLHRITREPALKLLDLALDLGFDGHSHFSAVFRRLVGRPPSAFRSDTAPTDVSGRPRRARRRNGLIPRGARIPDG
jgi:AraC-like DNA-binding protein